MGILEWINVTRSLNCTSLMFSKTFPVTDAINSLIHAGLYQMKIKFKSNYFYFGTKRQALIQFSKKIPDMYSIIKPDWLVSGLSKRLFFIFFMIERVKDLL